MDYLNHQKKNRHEEAVRQYFHSQGFQSLSRGWPDFVFFKETNEGKKEIVFVEVKPPQGETIKTHQGAIKEILETFGCDVRVAFGVDESGSPVYKKIEGRVVETATQWKKYKRRAMNIW